MAGILIGPENAEMRGRNAQHRRELEWIPPATRKPSVQSSFWEILMKYLKLYCENTCLVGVKYSVNKKATTFGRLMWFCGYIYIFYLTAYYVYGVYTEYLDGSISSSAEMDDLLNTELQFPGVAICSINKISKRAIMELTRKMFEANITTMTMDQIYNAILNLGDLYESLIIPEKDYSPTAELLSKFYNDDYEITDILEMLAPQCSVMFWECYFGGVKRNCKDIFRLSKTSNGFCCTFNYIVAEEDLTKANIATGIPEIFFIGSRGLDTGLMVSMRPFLDDYVYTTHPITGWKMSADKKLAKVISKCGCNASISMVMVFNPLDYPDSKSNGVFEVLVPKSSMEFIELISVGLKSDEVTQSYSVEKRGCIFADEQKSYHEVYTFNKCIVSCRIEDIWENCKCRPFYYPRYGHTKESRRTCGVQDIKCLKEYFARKLEIIPHHDETLMNMIPDKKRALVCDNCYPECDDTGYLATSSRTSLGFSNSARKLITNVNTTRQSILNVYFSEVGNLILKQDENYRWYEHLSDAGGICSFFIGFSIISIVELLYFFALFLLEVCGVSCVTTRKEDSNKTIMVQALYLNEYFPRPRIDERKYKGNNDRF